MCLATIKLEEVKRKSASMAMVNANIAAVIAEILEKYRSQIVKEVNALIVDILDKFVQIPATEDKKTSCQSCQSNPHCDRYLIKTLDRCNSSDSLKNKSSSLCHKTPTFFADNETEIDPNSKIDESNENTCVVEITVDSEETDTVWLGEDGEPVNLNIKEFSNDTNENPHALESMSTEISELAWLDNDGKSVSLTNGTLRDAFAVPLDHTYQLFENTLKRAAHDGIDAEVVLDSKNRNVQRRRSQISSNINYVDKSADETYKAKTFNNGSKKRVTTSSKDGTKKTPVKKALFKSNDPTKSQAQEPLTASSLQTAPSNSFRCELCNKQYKYKCDLKYHKLSHNGVRLFQCGVCGKCFNHPANKRNHERLHNPKEWFECATCGRAFPQKGNLKFHIMRWHGDKRHKKPRFRCQFCGKLYHQNRSYKRHFPKCEKRTTSLAPKQMSSVILSEASHELFYSELSP